MPKTFSINNRPIGPGHPTYIIAEISANHHQVYDKAAELVREAHACGADAVKLQTYTADTMTIACDKPWFQIGAGTIWEGKNLHELYQEAYTPWEWFKPLSELANELGIHLFSTPFDLSSVEFLESMAAPAYKIASFELVDLPLLRAVAATGKPVIMSTGMASKAEIDEAVEAIRTAGGKTLALLKCTSAYPAPANEMNLRTIPDMAKSFDVPVGLSDHTLETSVAVAAVCLGACIVEKHITMSRDTPGPDSSFSLEPDEFRQLVEAIRTTEGALGQPTYAVGEQEAASRTFRRSLFVVQDVAAGECFTANNVRAIRPGHGMHTRHLDEIIGKPAAVNIEKGTPLQPEHIG